MALVPLKRGPFGPTTNQPAKYKYARQLVSTIKVGPRGQSGFNGAPCKQTGSPAQRSECAGARGEAS